FYGPFHSEVQNTLENADRATNERELGVDPESGKKVIVRIGRFGPLVQIGGGEDDDQPRYASLRPGQMIETITFEEAMELFRLPKKVGIFEEKEMTVAVGRFGPYIRHNNAFYSLPKGMDPHEVNEETAVQIIKEKRQKDIEKIIRIFEENPEARIENGRWGPFIRYGKLNIKIPKGTEVETITYQQVLDWVAAEDSKPKAKGRASRKAGTNTSTTTTPKRTARKGAKTSKK